MGMAFALCLLCGCGEKEKAVLSSDPDGLKKARSLYQAENFTQAAQAFLQFKDISPQASSEEKEEATLGRLVCLLLAKQPWEKEMESWKPQGRGFWAGKSFIALENIPLEKREYFHPLLRKPDFPLAHFLLLQLLFMHQRLECLPTVICNMREYQKEAWDFVLMTAWAKARKEDFAQATSIFAIVQGQSSLTPAQKEEARQGLALMPVLASPRSASEVAFPESRELYLELQPIDFFRASSPLSAYEGKITDGNLLSSMRMVDLLFLFGGISNNPLSLWQKGLEFLEARQSEFDKLHQEAAYQTLRMRFLFSMAWIAFLQENFEAAEKQFSLGLADSQSQPLEEEGKLGLALLSWKKGASLTEAQNPLLSNAWEESYWLGGRKFSLYRIAERESRRQEIEKLCEQKQHRLDFIFLDILLLLGDGRSAHQLLDQIVSEYPEEIHTVYMAEEQNIPKDPYAENQIWEKLD